MIDDKWGESFQTLELDDDSKWSVFGLTTKRQLAIFWIVLCLSVSIFVTGITMIIMNPTIKKLEQLEQKLPYTPHYVDTGECRGWAIVSADGDIKILPYTQELNQDRISLVCEIAIINFMKGLEK